VALRAEEAEALNTALADGGLTPDHPSAVFGAGRGRAAGAPDDDTLYVAFAARTSGEELQDPTISIPRQLESCRRALPPNAVIVAFYWDVESGRKEIDDRGTGAHDKFEIAVPRDGGLPELLAEAKRKDRRFDAVICESVDRIARLMHQSTRVEHELDRVGVPLFAADEGVETTRRKSTKILVRRTKQMLAEWYVRQMLELAWDGYCEHTRQGWNIGVPPYGYVGERVPHPVPAKREQGMTKTRLVPEPVRAAAVHQIFVWRVTERLSYDVIANRLNADLDRYPPKKANRPDQHRDTWSHNGVRDVLENPKYTGYMVWNRRASKTGAGKLNPPRDWVWSPMPTHEPLVTVDMFKAAQAVKSERSDSWTRTSSGLDSHPGTKRTYALRSFVFCAQCRHRMYGKTRHTRSYYGCQPRVTRSPEEVLPSHQKSVWVREDVLLEGVLRFLAERVLGPDRKEHVRAELAAAAPNPDKAAEKEAAALRRAVEDIDRKKARLVKQLEDRDDPDGTIFRAVRERLSELTAERQHKLAKLGAVLDLMGHGADADNDADVLDELPIATVADLSGAPEPIMRTLFSALRLRVVFDGRTGDADCTVTVTDDTLTAVWGAVTALCGGAATDHPTTGLEMNGPTATQGLSLPMPWRPRHARSPIRTAPGT